MIYYCVTGLNENGNIKAVYVRGDLDVKIKFLSRYPDYSRNIISHPAYNIETLVGYIAPTIFEF